MIVMMQTVDGPTRVKLVRELANESCRGCAGDRWSMENGVCPRFEGSGLICMRAETDGAKSIWIEDTPEAIAEYTALRMGS